MSHPFDLSGQLANFSGRAPLFPLPNVAFFPHVLLPLHVFEPRYRQMTLDALAGDRYIAMAQLRPGWEEAPGAELPAIYTDVCLGRIGAEEQLSDGRFYLVLQGLSRARVVREESSDLPYRTATLELRPDRVLTSSTLDRENRQREILEAFRDLYPRLDLDRILQEALDTTVGLGLMCDVIASALKLPPEQSQQLLAEDDIDLRSDLVLMRLRELRRRARENPKRVTFPPEFSVN